MLYYLIMNTGDLKETHNHPLLSTQEQQLSGLRSSRLREEAFAGLALIMGFGNAGYAAWNARELFYSNFTKIGQSEIPYVVGHVAATLICFICVYYIAKSIDPITEEIIFLEREVDSAERHAQGEIK